MYELDLFFKMNKILYSRFDLKIVMYSDLPKIFREGNRSEFYKRIKFFLIPQIPCFNRP